MRIPHILMLAVCLFILFAPATALRAEWIENGNPVCTYLGHQQRVRAVTDGNGGAIIAWSDPRFGDEDIFAQRIDGHGNTLWTSGGIQVCIGGIPKDDFEMISDGEGGAIFAWSDLRDNATSHDDLYAQRIDADGILLWTAGGVAICTVIYGQFEPVLATDSNGGAIIVWNDARNLTWIDIYAQRIDAAGIPQWTADGVNVCVLASTDKYHPAVARDANAGASIFWVDDRNGNADIFVQKLNYNGSPMYGGIGNPACEAPYEQRYPAAISDEFGGVIVAWEDYRSNSDWDVFAQRISQSGLYVWTSDGDSVCTADYNQTSVQLVSDGLQGAIITWQDDRNGYTDIYAQRASSFGGTQVWGIDGVPVSRAYHVQRKPCIVSDGVSGAIIAWEDYRFMGGYDVFAQRVDEWGNGLWMQDGWIVSMTIGNQLVPQIVSDGAKGAIIAFEDTRTGIWDIYAQRMERNGYWGYPAPQITGARDVPGDQGGSINLSWDASRLDIDPEDRIGRYTIWRAIEETMAMAWVERGARLVTLPGSWTDRSADTPMTGVENEATAFAPTETGLIGTRPIVRREILGSAVYYWALIDSVQSSLYVDHYSHTVATLFDSTSAGFEYHYFQVIAHEADPYAWWTSDIDSGYSVDNLAPIAPQCLAGEQSFIPEGLSLTWAPNEEPDFDCYQIYRGTDPGFLPDAGNLIASQCDTMLFDGGWRWDAGYCYKVTAVDRNGNESEYAPLCSDAITGEETPVTPLATYLEQNFPNPFNPATRISFGIAEPGYVRLRIYDAAGRLVRALIEEHREEGTYSEVWDGRDDAGRHTVSGVYFYKLNAGAFENTKKMVLLK